MIVRPDAPPLTVEQYRNLPETGPRYQLIGGDLYIAPAPNRYHQDISRNLEFILLENKKRTYARPGVNELWIIDAVPCELSRFAFELDRENPIERFAAADRVTTPLLPGLVVELEEVFRQ
jgi:Uma2 family endonuclease